ncbi:3'-5' exonuclease [Sphingomonas aerophila]|uniref:DNA polymerase-3 subunit epsilon n=1 Tax=Sphingomonas aerophila TaxID=1344948 RepID=A0A7W9BF05_9SPHN|nr:3'-5' exonuclease [Sphingomonas aerophila]MBB5716040.1 DNA polymerase-3 subunit epsilon [Sphingomonas aerophila]
MDEDHDQLAARGTSSAAPDAFDRMLEACSAWLTSDADRQEQLATTLHATGNYRILRRLRPAQPLDRLPDGARLGIVLDVETTGVDAALDEIIELAMVPFAYTIDGQVLGTLAPFHAYRQPTTSIPDEISALTGITDAMVAGQAIDSDAVAAFIAEAVVVIAHNARFDRRFVERSWPCFANIAWACSMSQVDWRAEGFEGTKLAYLLAGTGFFHEGHRATDDCLATVALLGAALPSGATGLDALLRRAREPSWIIHAEHAPFERKDLLKRRGYRWSGNDGVPAKCWWREVPDDGMENERSFLDDEIYGYKADPIIRRVTAWERFSDRC